MRFRSILMLSAVALSMVACSEKEEEKPKASVKDIAGSYAGYTVASCAYMQNVCSPDETITISENADGTATVSFTSNMWGEFSIPNAQMSEAGGVYSLTGSGKTEMGMGDRKSAYDCTFTATIKGKPDARMQFTVPAVMGGLTVDFASGDAPDEMLPDDGQEEQS